SAGIVNPSILISIESEATRALNMEQCSGPVRDNCTTEQRQVACACPEDCPAVFQGASAEYHPAWVRNVENRPRRNDSSSAAGHASISPIHRAEHPHDARAAQCAAGQSHYRGRDQATATEVGGAAGNGQGIVGTDGVASEIGGACAEYVAASHVNQSCQVG